MAQPQTQQRPVDEKLEEKKKQQAEKQEKGFYGYKPKHDNFYPELDD